MPLERPKVNRETKMSSSFRTLKWSTVRNGSHTHTHTKSLHLISKIKKSFYFFVKIQFQTAKDHPLTQRPPKQQQHLYNKHSSKTT